MTTPRVAIAAPTADDADEFVAAVLASRDVHHPWTAPPDTADAYAAWLDRACDPRHAPHLVRLADGDRAIVGAVNLSEIIRGPLQSCFIGWYGITGRTGRGLMTEAIALVLDRGFRPVNADGLGLHRIEANIQPGNERSRRLAERMGFRLEGFSPRYLRVDGDWRDHERWAKTVEDPRPPRA